MKIMTIIREKIMIMIIIIIIKRIIIIYNSIKSNLADDNNLEKKIKIRIKIKLI